MLLALDPGMNDADQSAGHLSLVELIALVAIVLAISWFVTRKDKPLSERLEEASLELNREQYISDQMAHGRSRQEILDELAAVREELKKERSAGDE